MKLHIAQPEPDSEYSGILERANQAFTLAQCAAGETAVVLATDSEGALQKVERCERDLDRIDRETDASIASAIAGARQSESRDLLACLKFIIDLERIGDLLSSVATCGRSLGPRLTMDDMTDLLRMCCIVERMTADAQRAYSERNVNQALEVLRLDGELDRLRNVMLCRHLERAQFVISSDTVKVLFMAQSLERAGDHVKNVAEEICHLVSGHTIRHLIRSMDRPSEQIHLNWNGSSLQSGAEALAR